MLFVQRLPSVYCQACKLINMFYRLLRLLAILTLLVIFTDCSKETGEKPTDLALKGTWIWVRTDGGLANHIHQTPANTGMSMELKFDAGNRYFIYTNGALISEGSYLLQERNCIHDHTDKTYIDFSNDPGMLVEKLDHQTLELSDNAYDGIGSLYQRKQDASR